MATKPPTKGERAYQMRSDSHETWDAIADTLDTSASSATIVARKFAKKRGLDWPIPVPTLSPIQEPEKHAVAKWAYHDAENRPSRRRWHVMAGSPCNRIGADGAGLQYLAEQYAGDNDLAWPPVSKVASLQEQSYTLAATGMRWAEVAEKVGFDHVPNAKESAARWAANNDLAWPLFRKSRKTYKKAA